MIRFATALPVMGTVTVLPAVSPGEQRVNVQVLLPAESPPKGKYTMALTLEGPVAAMLTPPASGATYLMTSFASRLPLVLSSAHTIQPAAQSLPEPAQLVGDAAIQAWTLRLREAASFLASDKSATSSLACAVRRLLVTKVRYDGTAKPSRMVSTLIVTISSISVKPCSLLFPNALEAEFEKTRLMVIR